MKSKKVRILSFIGGLAFFSIIATALIVKNDKLRAELERQASTLLNTSKRLLDQAQFVVGKIEKISGETKIAKKNSNINGEKKLSSADRYDAMWELIEVQKAEHLNK